MKAILICFLFTILSINAKRSRQEDEVISLSNDLENLIEDCEEAGCESCEKLGGINIYSKIIHSIKYLNEYLNLNIKKEFKIFIKNKSLIPKKFIII